MVLAMTLCSFLCSQFYYSTTSDATFVRSTNGCYRREILNEQYVIRWQCQILNVCFAFKHSTNVKCWMLKLLIKAMLSTDSSTNCLGMAFGDRCHGQRFCATFWRRLHSQMYTCGFLWKTVHRISDALTFLLVLVIFNYSVFILDNHQIRFFVIHKIGFMASTDFLYEILIFS